MPVDEKSGKVHGGGIVQKAVVQYPGDPDLVRDRKMIGRPSPESDGWSERGKRQIRRKDDMEGKTGNGPGDEIPKEFQGGRGEKPFGHFKKPPHRSQGKELEKLRKTGKTIRRSC